ncbi:MAG: DUF6084 family protein [Pyrinomonadaceae bacterium]
MPDLDFSVESAEPLPFSMSPQLVFKLRVTNTDAGETIQSVMLRCQIQIETVRRQYNADEKANLFELYGEPERWGQTLKTLLWTHTTASVQNFTGTTVVDLQVPCTFDFNVATTKYFDGLGDGDIPLCLLFSGTIFYHDETGALQISQISWEKEANYRLPVKIWKEMMELYYPNSAWLNIQKDIFDKLQDYKTRNSLPNWERVFSRLLADDLSVDEAVDDRRSAATNENRANEGGVSL